MPISKTIGTIIIFWFVVFWLFIALIVVDSKLPQQYNQTVYKQGVNYHLICINGVVFYKTGHGIIQAFDFDEKKEILRPIKCNK